LYYKKLYIKERFEFTKPLVLRFDTDFLRAFKIILKLRSTDLIQGILIYYHLGFKSVKAL